MGKARLYTDAALSRLGMASSIAAVRARAFLSGVRLSLADVISPEARVSDFDLLQINHRLDRLLFVRHLAAHGCSMSDAIAKSGVARNTWYRWNARYERSCRNPRSLLDASRAPKTPRRRTKAMMCGALLSFFFMVETGDRHSASPRPMARIVAGLRDVKGLIRAAERGKNATRTGFKRIWGHAWIDRLKGKRDLPEEFGHFEIDHLVLKKTETCPAARIFVAVDKITHWVFMRAYTNATADSAAAFLQDLLGAAGIIRSVQTDNGSEFKGAFTEWLEERGIKQKAIKAGDPTWNNQVENINNILRMRCLNFHRDEEIDFKGLQRLLMRFCHEFNHMPYFGNPLPPPRITRRTA